MGSHLLAGRHRGSLSRARATGRLLVAVTVFASAFVSVRSQSAGGGQTTRTDAPGVTLTAGAVIEERAEFRSRHRYQVPLSAGDFFDVGVTQDRIMVRLSLYDGDRVLRSINVPDMDPLPERLMFLAPAAGRYVLEVEAQDHAPAPRGSERFARPAPADPGEPGYSLSVLAMRPATWDDEARLKGFDALERAEKAERLETMAGLRAAIPLYLEAADGFHSLGDSTIEASALEALAHLTSYFTEFHQQAASTRERLADVYARLGLPEQEAINLRQLGVEYEEDGRLDAAKQAVSRSLAIAAAHDLRANIAWNERQLGIYDFDLGNYEQARDHAMRAQSLAAAIPFRAMESLTMLDLAQLDAVAGDLDAAVAHCRRGLPLADALPARATLTLWLGFFELARGELDAAASTFEERLTLSRSTVQRDQEALARLGLGDIDRAGGNRAAAQKRYEDAAAALENGAQPYRCVALQRLGRMDLEDGRVEDAQGRFRTMLDIATLRRNPTCEIEARAGLADAAARRGDLDAADADARRVVDLSEEFREAAVNLESRSLGFGALAPAYERAIDLAMQRAARGDGASADRALTLNEQALGRGLLDRVFEARLDASARVPDALADERRRVRERWRARLAELQVAVRRQPDAPRTKALAAETSALEVQVRDLAEQIDAADVRHATFLRPRPLPLDGIQALLDADTVLLEYALGDARSYLWVVSRDGMKTFTLAPRAELEALARRVHEDFARLPGGSGTRAAAARGGDRRALSERLIAPAADLIAGKRLVVVPGGALSLIPFSALPDPAGRGARAPADVPPLMARHEVVQVPSATILGAMRVLTAGRARPAKTAAVFADPVFDAGDPRVRVSDAAESGSRREDLHGLSLTRLPFSRGEADAIASLAPSRVAVFLGADATRERALNRALYDFRFIHFATHGLVNDAVASTSSLVLSRVDGRGRSRDGLLMLPDIYDMTLNADVVVLSGCQTALGKTVRGEGPIGLARAFMYAGVPRVVASLWQVDDLATAELMKRFYRGMLVDRLTAAAALRAAQRALAADQRWSAPYFWAPFVLQGDWR